MKSTEMKQRFDELDAARAFGDLSPEEQAEWTQLINKHGFSSDFDLDLLVAGLDATLAEDVVAPSADLVKKLEGQAAGFSPKAAVAEAIPFWRNPALGWAAAACFAVALVVMNPRAETDPSSAELRETLIAGADVLQLEFAGTPEFENLTGDVVWTDDGQSGFMRFTGLPANDPTKTQYQLWIVDPTRDERPVDGGVFNIPSDGGEVVVPIRAALRVDSPVAFVITVEQPGGVVVSKQEIVAAIAQRG